MATMAARNRFNGTFVFTLPVLSLLLFEFHKKKLS